MSYIYVQCSVLSFTVVCFFTSTCAVWATGVSTDDLLGELKTACATATARPEGDPLLRPKGVQDVVDKWVALGEDGVPAAAAAIRQGDGSVRCVESALQAILWMNNGPRASEAILSIAVTGKKREWALVALSQRRITVAVSDEMYSGIVRNLQGGPDYAEILAKCEAVPVQRRVAPLLAELIAEVRAYGATLSSLSLSKLPANTKPAPFQFIEGFHLVGKSAVPWLREAYEKESDESLKLWLLMASGAAGDETIAEKLAKVIQEAPGSCLESMAVFAYAHALRQNSIPFLSNLAESDKSDGFDARGLAVYPLRERILSILREYDRSFVAEFQKQHPAEKIPDFGNP
jgi:hypothetical protein